MVNFSNPVKNIFKFVRTRFKKLFDYFEIFDDISVDNVLLVSTGIIETAALFCIVTVYELLFLASLQ